jgi:MFS superfamily sulfate permease-like transporter
VHQAPLSIDINQESVAQALANTGAGLFQGMPVSTSLSASSLNDHSGAKTGLASLTSGLTVLLTPLLLAPLFSDLPKAVLAAVIIEAVVMGMMNISEMRRLARVQRFDFWIAMTGIAATLVFGLLAGVMIGIALSPLWLIAVTTRPNIALLRREPGTQVYRDISSNPAPPRSISSPVLIRPKCLARSLTHASTSAMKVGMANAKKTISNTSSSVSTTPLLVEIGASHFQCQHRLQLQHRGARPHASRVLRHRSRAAATGGVLAANRVCAEAR